MGKYEEEKLANRPILEIQWSEEFERQIQIFAEYFMNRRIANGMYGGGRGRGQDTPSYLIQIKK
jgi:hypothetical protein